MEKRIDDKASSCAADRFRILLQSPITKPSLYHITQVQNTKYFFCNYKEVYNSIIKK